jgi:F0F1-type ATP synthase membrane subunit b/b'
MNIQDSFDIRISDSLIQRLQQTKEAAKQSLNNIYDKAQQVTTQSTENAIDTLNNTIEQAKDSLGENLPQVSVENVINSSVADWFEQHPAFLGIIKSFNWAASHPIVSLILFVFSLAILWSVIKAVGRLIETASLSILKIPLKLLGTLIKYCWRWLGKFSSFVIEIANTKPVNNNPELQLQNNTAYQIITYDRQQRLKDISARLEEIQTEQQQLLKEAADILDAEKNYNSVHMGSKGITIQPHYTDSNKP